MKTFLKEMCLRSVLWSIKCFNAFVCVSGPLLVLSVFALFACHFYTYFVALLPAIDRVAGPTLKYVSNSLCLSFLD